MGIPRGLQGLSTALDSFILLVTCALESPIRAFSNPRMSLEAGAKRSADDPGCGRCGIGAGAIFGDARTGYEGAPVFGTPVLNISGDQIYKGTATWGAPIANRKGEHVYEGADRILSAPIATTGGECEYEGSGWIRSEQKMSGSAPFFNTRHNQASDTNAGIGCILDAGQDAKTEILDKFPVRPHLYWTTRM